MPGLFRNFNNLGNPNTFQPYQPGYTVGQIQPSQSYSSMPVMNPQMQQTPRFNPVTMPQSNIIWISSKDDIQAYPTGRGWQQLFGVMNDDANLFYLRETDLNGVIQPIKTIRYEIVDETESSKEVSASSPAPVPTEQPAVSREEFDSLTNAVNTLTTKLADLLN